MKKQIKDLKVGEFFTVMDWGEKEVQERAVWVRGEYDRGSRTYACYRYTDVNHEHFFRGKKEVFTEFFF